MKYNNFAIFFDGTWNDHTTETNVWLLRSDIRMGEYEFEGEDDRYETDAYYVSGPGTSADMAVFGGALAADLSDAIVDAYAWLCARLINLQKSSAEAVSRVFLFGFSRGAYRAHVFSWLLNEVGIVDDFSIAREVAKKWCEHDTKEVKTLLAKSKVTVAPRIALLGLWDVVSAPLDIQKNFNDGQRASLVERISHAMAANEHRVNFPVMKYDAKDPMVEQVWFPGAHSDVGGGYPPDERTLSNVALKWMKYRAYEAGLDFLNPPEEEAKGVNISAIIATHDKSSWLRKKFNVFNRKYEEGEGVHPVLTSLLSQNVGYKTFVDNMPSNMLEHQDQKIGIA